MINSPFQLVLHFLPNFPPTLNFYRRLHRNECLKIKNCCFFSRRAKRFVGQGKLSCGKPNFSSILSATDETLPRSRFKRGAKEIFDESFKIFSLLSPGSANVSQKLFPCLLPHISQRKQQAAQITTVKGEMSALRFFHLFNPLSICFLRRTICLSGCGKCMKLEL